MGGNIEGRGVLFDMDGVLVDSESYWVPLEEEQIFPWAVADGADRPAASEITGMNVRDVFEYLDDRYDLVVDEDEFVDRYDAVAREIYTERVALLEDAHDLLRALRDRDDRVGLVSSSPHRWIAMVLDRFDLTFDAVVSAEDVDRGKPHPDVYRSAARRVDRPPEDCVAVEDSEHGIAAATAAGMTCVGYADGETDLDRSAADAVADGPAELRRLLLDD